MTKQIDETTEYMVIMSLRSTINNPCVIKEIDNKCFYYSSTINRDDKQVKYLCVLTEKQSGNNLEIKDWYVVDEYPKDNIIYDIREFVN